MTEMARLETNGILLLQAVFSTLRGIQDNDIPAAFKTEICAEWYVD